MVVKPLFCCTQLGLLQNIIILDKWSAALI